MNDSRKLRDRSWAYLTELFRDMDSEPKIMIPLLLSALAVAAGALSLFSGNMPLAEYMQNCAIIGASAGWVLGCIMVVICFCIQIESNEVIEGKMNFGCGVITGIIVFLWFITITIVFLAPVAWFIRMF